MANNFNPEALQGYYTKAIEIAKPHLSDIDIKALAANATSIAVEYAKSHPKSTALSAISIGLSPVLGSGWMAMPLIKLIGFTPLGPAAGESRSVRAAAVW